VDPFIFLTLQISSYPAIRLMTERLF